MKIEGDKQAPETRRFSAVKPGAPKEGGKSFGALLKKAAATATPANPATPAAPASPSHPSISAPAPKAEETQSESVKASAPAPDTSFADHMETVRFRLKTGYYTTKAIDDALTEKLTGYFDDLT